MPKGIPLFGILAPGSDAPYPSGSHLPGRPVARPPCRRKGVKTDRVNACALCECAADPVPCLGTPPAACRRLAYPRTRPKRNPVRALSRFVNSLPPAPALPLPPDTSRDGCHLARGEQARRPPTCWQRPAAYFFFFFFLSGRWVKADPAAVFAFLLDFRFRKVSEAAVAALLLVCSPFLMSASFV